MPKTLVPATVLACGLLISPAAFSQQADIPASSEAVRFDIWEFQIEGNSVLAAALIERAVSPYLGVGKEFADVEGAREALNNAYRDNGYPAALVTIPLQNASKGAVTLKVTEGLVENVRVLGSKYYSQERIRAKLPSVASGSVPYFPAVQAQLNTVNRFPGRSVSPVMRPGRNPGTTEIDLMVEERRPYGASLELNNRYSPNTTRSRLNGSAHYENLWQREHNLNFQFQTAPEQPSEAKVFSATYLMPSDGSDRMYAFYAVKSDSQVGALADLTVLGKGTIFGARAILPFAQNEKRYHSLSLGVDYKNFDESVGQAGDPAIDTPIKYLPFSVNYDLTAQDADGYWQFSTGWGFTFRGLISDQSEFENKRFKARDNYLVWKLDLRRVQKLPGGFSLLARMDGQLADQPLVANEQYTAGGADSVRGYLESEQAGDNAVHAVLELRSPALAGDWSKSIDELSLHAFVEGARLFVKSPLPAQTDRFDLSGAGLGFRVKAWKMLGAGLDLAWPLVGTANTKAGDAHLHVSVRMEF